MNGITVTQDPRVDFLREVIRPGDSFCDVGGVEKQEMVTVAASLGAKRVAMIDARHEDDPLWQSFRERADAALGDDTHLLLCYGPIENFYETNFDPFDVVHCGSVLHHVKNVDEVLAGLRRATRRDCILTLVIAEDWKHAQQLQKLVGPNVGGWTKMLQHELQDWCWVPSKAEAEERVRRARFEIVSVIQHWHGHLLTMRLT